MRRGERSKSTTDSGTQTFINYIVITSEPVLPWIVTEVSVLKWLLMTLNTLETQTANLSLRLTKKRLDYWCLTTILSNSIWTYTLTGFPVWKWCSCFTLKQKSFEANNFMIRLNFIHTDRLSMMKMVPWTVTSLYQHSFHYFLTNRLCNLLSWNDSSRFRFTCEINRLFPREKKEAKFTRTRLTVNRLNWLWNLALFKVHLFIYLFFLIDKSCK